MSHPADPYFDQFAQRARVPAGETEFYVTREQLQAMWRTAWEVSRERLQHRPRFTVQREDTHRPIAHDADGNITASELLTSWSVYEKRERVAGPFDTEEQAREWVAAHA